ncbi:hypothetical protein [Litchfieldia salsa]|uniref:Type IV pilus assembly protein PilO n=1 Tax=Litchfieldia salsa TaxID=930152 RepID=A0A1H0NTP4_9BACI|nr:hypothetical protein [Litchfieldia salsa]SDO96043.1 type IV pilus assembly protein PilO [Litchfieldia salsa]
MTLRFTKKHIITLIFSMVIIVGATYLTSILLIDPIELEIDRLESNVVMQEKLIDTLKQKQSNADTPVVSSTEIQKKIPVIPLVEQLILDIEQAEAVSNSEIVNLAFSEADFSLPAPVEPNQTTATTEQAEATTEEQPQNNETTTEVVEEQVEVFDPTIVEGLKQVTVTIAIKSPGYYELEKFLSLIEHQTRIAKVDSLNFTGKSEVVSVAQEDIDEPLTYTVTLSTFYMPAYPELAVEAPKVNYPDPSEKKNPLFVNTSEEDE